MADTHTCALQGDTQDWGKLGWWGKVGCITQRVGVKQGCVSYLFLTRFLD